MTTDPQQPEATAGPSRRRVALVVFAECDAVDDQNAAHAAALALRQAMTGSPLGELPHVETVGAGERSFDATFVDVLDAGVALANGYLWAAPTNKAWRDRGLPPCP